MGAVALLNTLLGRSKSAQWGDVTSAAREEMRGAATWRTFFRALFKELVGDVENPFQVVCAWQDWQDQLGI